MTLIRRLIDARLTQVRAMAQLWLDGADDRSRLFVLELADAQGRLTDLVISALAAIVVAVVAVVWVAATVVALCWNTEWRLTALLGVLGFWVLTAAYLMMRARDRFQASQQMFPLTRQTAQEDLDQLREAVR